MAKRGSISLGQGQGRLELWRVGDPQRMEGFGEGWPAIGGDWGFILCLLS